MGYHNWIMSSLGRAGAIHGSVRDGSTRCSGTDPIGCGPVGAGNRNAGLAPRDAVAGSAVHKMRPALMAAAPSSRRRVKDR
ncbi:hypothetical protein GCM10027610_088430 [Dactylosporangium cerinum]